ncbi:TonB-dependent receptor [soil metagenome]
MKVFYLCTTFIVVLFSISPLFAQEKFTISGYIRDSSTGEELIGAAVTIKELSGTGTITNTYGFYSLTLPKGNFQINYSFIGYEGKSIEVELQNPQIINIELAPKELQLKEVIITSGRLDEHISDIQMSRENLAIEKIRSIPALFGEVDIIKSLQLLPGIQSAGEGTTGLFVRGGSADQNLILLDEATVYNASHFLGFFSVFNSDAIKNVEIYKGGIPARFGGRLSSILDIQMKEGNNKNFTASGGIGTISSRLTVEGPIVKDKASFIVSGRRTYADLFLRLSSNENLNSNVLYFYDFNVKANYKINEKNRIFASGYFGRDVFNFDNTLGINWGNATATVRWNHLFNNRLFLNTTFLFSRFDYGFDFDDAVANFKWRSDLKEQGMKTDFTYYLNPSNTVTFGTNTLLHQFSPAHIQPGDGSIFETVRLDNKYAIEQAFYGSNEQKISDRLSLEYGLRYSMFQNVGRGRVFVYEDPQNLSDEQIIDTLVYGNLDKIKFYHGLEPRMAARYMFTPSSSFKASYNRMRQYLQIASNITAGLPIDRWIPSDTYIEPLIGDQIAVGYFRNFNQNTIEASVELYFKWMHNLVDFKPSANILLNNNIETEVLEGRGWAYGAEFMLRKNIGRTTGWLSYTLSRTQRQIEGINRGRPYNARYDRTHDVSVVLSNQVSRRLSLATNWVYITGSAVSFPSGQYRLDQKLVVYYNPNLRNNNRMPDYHRLDLSLNLEGRNRRNRSWQGSWNFSLYNVYARKNVFSISFEEVVNGQINYDPERDGPVTSRELKAVKLYLFSIIPSVTYNFKFHQL